jgi:hypothetical protein
MRFLIAAVASLVWSWQLPTLPTILPVDQAAQEPDLSAVRDRVLQAARTHDVGTLMQFVSHRLEVDGDVGTDGSHWRALADHLSDPRMEEWKGLEESLAFGGAFVVARAPVQGRREFCAPYYFAVLRTKVPPAVQGEVSPWVIVDKDVPVHSAADAKSPILGTLSFAAVQSRGAALRDPNNSAVLWKSIDLSETQVAFVDSAKIRNPEGYHVCFAHEDGTWVVSSFAHHW